MDMNRYTPRFSPAARPFSHLNSFEHIQAMFLAASQLKSAVVRRQVMNVLGGALDNADDSAGDSFGKFEQAEYGNVRYFWLAMFYGSAQALSCEREIDNKAAKRWLAARGLQG
jgi:hypothetical protein